MNDSELKAIKDRCEKATPGPWWDNVKNKPTGGRNKFYDCEAISIIVDHEGCEVWPWNRYEDMEFAYRARQDIPNLLAHIEELSHP